MKKQFIYYHDIDVKVEYSYFTSETGKDEAHVILHVASKGDLFEKQLCRLEKGTERFLGELGHEMNIAMKRYFVSDSANQASKIKNFNSYDTSIIQQPPLDGSKVGLWIYLIKGAHVKVEEKTNCVYLSNYTLFFDLGMQNNSGNSEEQTRALLEEYENRLAKRGATLANNCLRTWFYVRDVDTQYQGMVKARRENFVNEGLTEHTHYLASTGIQGLPSDTKAILQLGAIGMLGLEEKQQKYLYAPTHLNPTYEYGVTFERGTAVYFKDRTHAYISGTASINNKGEVVHVGDIVGQTKRMVENVEELLKEADMKLDDIAQAIVYLRDLCDYEIVKPMLTSLLGNTPLIFTLAPVCRPEWLIEMECIGIKKSYTEEFKSFS